MSALMLDLSLRNSWGDLAGIVAEEIDNDEVERVLLKHDSGVSVLAAPRRPQEAEMLTEAQVGRVFEFLRQQSDGCIPAAWVPKGTNKTHFELDL